MHLLITVRNREGVSGKPHQYQDKHSQRPTMLSVPTGMVLHLSGALMNQQST